MPMPVPMPSRRSFLLQGAGVAWAAGLAPGVAVAQGLPAARVLIGAPAGGAGDTFLRKVADKMRGGYAGSMIVDNRAGAGGQIALMATREAAGDGATMLMTPSTFFSLYPHTYKKLPYNPESDFALVSLMAYTNFGLAVGPMVPAEVGTLQEFLAWAKANPDKATYGSPAPGSVPHLVTAIAGHARGVELRHIPYKGSVPGIQDMRGGQIAAMSSPIGALVPHLQHGVRVLAVTGEARSPLLPQVRTYREQGVPIVGREWFGMVLPGSADAGVVSRVAAHLKLALQQPDVIEGAAQLGLEVASSTPQEMAQMVRADSDEWRVWVKRIGFSAES
jgi:tripartite-type tricarboxylate transporter receptor subunit TctC